MNKLKVLPEIFWIYAIVLVGIIFRLWFISLAPQPFGWDQYEYVKYAAKIFGQPLMLASHSYRSYPYPLLLAFLYKIVGFGNQQAVFYLQAVLDSLVGLIIYAVLRYGLKNKAASLLGLILYTFNPFTAGYVGVLLAEVLTGFFMAATVFFGMLFVKKTTWSRALVFGFCAGMAAETRNAAFIWTAVPIGLTLIWVSFKKHKTAFFGVILGLILTMIYPLYVNWRDYHEINVTTVDDFYAKEFFQGALLKTLPPFTYVYPIELKLMWNEYYSEYFPGRTSADRRAMAKKYYYKGWAIIARDPWDYLVTRIFKMWYVWQKENVFFYQEPGFASHRKFTYFGNIILLETALIGLVVSWAKLVKNNPGKWVLAVICGSIVYATLAFSLTHAEYRLTIPFYPLLFISAPIGIIYFWRNLGYLYSLWQRRF